MLSLRAALEANRSITVTASMLGVSDRWFCSIIRHSSSEYSLMCNVSVVNRIRFAL